MSRLVGHEVGERQAWRSIEMTPLQLERPVELDSGGAPVVFNSHGDVLAARWMVAAAQARAAYECWCLDRSSDSYATYRAAADRADAAQDALAAQTRSRA